MAPTKKPSKSAKKEKVFHPESRKAEQLGRKQLRKSKLAGHAAKRAKLHTVKGKCGSFFYILSLSSVASSEAGPRSLTACEKKPLTKKNIILDMQLISTGF